MTINGYVGKRVARRIQKRRAFRRRLCVILGALVICCIFIRGLVAVRDCLGNVKLMQYQLESTRRSNVELMLENATLQKQLGVIKNKPQCKSISPVFYNLPLSTELQAYTFYTCLDYDIDYELVLAIMWTESNYTPSAISSTDDYGLMQINIINHKWLADALGFESSSTDTYLDPEYNIQAGVYLLSMMMTKYKTESKAIMAYSLGETGAARLWTNGIYTSSYVEKVLYRKSLILKNEYNKNII